MDLGYELHAILPFFAEIYASEFQSATSRADFEAMLAQATAVFELPGSRQDAPEAYGVLAKTLVRQCDVLIAVWNAAHEAGPGGTAAVVRAARHLGIPVVHVLSTAPQTIRLFSFGEGGPADGWGEELERAIARLLIPHPQAANASQLEAATYFAERRPIERPRLFRFIWKRQVRAVAKSAWSAQRPLSLKPHFEWADALAKRYGGLFRTGYVILYALSATSVCAALLSIVWEEQSWSTWIELVLIMIMIAIYRAQTKRAWHLRWIAYRHLAEQLRVMDLLLPLGWTMPSFRAPGHVRQCDPAQDELRFHFRAVVREVGLKTQRLSNKAIEECRSAVHARVKEQVRYQLAGARRVTLIHECLHGAERVLLWVVCVACVAHLVFHEHHPLAARWSVVAAGVLPAIGAALAGISAQGELRRLADRHKAMARRLVALRREIGSQESGDYHALGTSVEEIAHVMIGETEDWRVLLASRPFPQPG